MWPMTRRAYTGLTTCLLGLSATLLVGSIMTLQTNWLQRADVLIQFAIFPGGLIAGGILFLIHGCVEHYADLLPAKYRQRKTTRPEWETLYGTQRMVAVASVLQQFARLHGFRTSDAFQFRPEDRINDLMEESYPSCSDTDALFRQLDLTNSAAKTPTQACLREYVDARIGTNYGSTDRETNADKEPNREESSSRKIDRQARDHLVNAIRRYINEALTAFAFDDEINEIRAETADGTVHAVVDALWLCYDDCKDHLAGLSKQEWDYVQRLLLLLESDGELQFVRQRRWSIRQAGAVGGLLAFARCVHRFGIGWHLFGFALLFGPLSILLAYGQSRTERRRAKNRLPLAPFSSISELRAIRKTVTRFAKQKYPAGALPGRVHSRLMTTAVWLQTAVLWSFLSPLILLFQALPERDVHPRIRHSSISR